MDVRDGYEAYKRWIWRWRWIRAGVEMDVRWIWVGCGGGYEVEVRWIWRCLLRWI